MRLRHLWTGEITHRELINLIKYLPRESALARALYGEQADWDPALHRLTDIADLLIVANWQRAEGNTSPEFMQRPDAEQPKQKQLTPAEFDALFDWG
ncbi:MAG: hypothetical protein JWN52_8098 [Actinomycetia bacterium]|nr:hypothetical protein [Actinomycetes bacterium]